MASEKDHVDGWDALALCGLVAVEYGVAQWSTPAAWVLGGLLAIVVAVVEPILLGKVKVKR